MSAILPRVEEVRAEIPELRLRHDLWIILIENLKLFGHGCYRDVMRLLSKKLGVYIVLLLLSSMERCGCSSDKIVCECSKDPTVQTERILILCESIMGQNQSALEFHEKHERNLTMLTTKVDGLTEIVKEKDALISQMNKRIQELEQMLRSAKCDPQTPTTKSYDGVVVDLATEEKLVTSSGINGQVSTNGQVSGTNGQVSPGSQKLSRNDSQVSATNGQVSPDSQKLSRTDSQVSGAQSSLEEEQENSSLDVSSSQDSEVSSTTMSREKVKNVYSGTIDQVMDQICANIKLDSEETKKRNAELQEVIRKRVINGLKEDALFDKLYFDLAGTGSFYEGLKVSHPDEFDLNLIMRLPNMPVRTVHKEAQDKSMPTIEITVLGAPPGYLCVNNLGAVLKYIKENNPAGYAIYKGMESWCDPKGSLRQSKFKAWMEGLVSKFKNKYKEDIKREFKFNHFDFKKSGPAMTLEMDSVSIDLVPVFEVRPTDDVTLIQFKQLPVDPKNPMSWYLVPKPASGDKYDHAWRFSCYRHERYMIENVARLKPAIKLIKKLRDTKQWKTFHSYYIKTATFWVNSENKINWKNKLDQVFLQLLKEIQKRVENDKVWHYWDPRCNMLGNMKPVARENIATGMKRVINILEVAARDNKPEVFGEMIAPYKD